VPIRGPRRHDLLALVRQAFGERYTVHREIGRGGAARVFLATAGGGEKVALKILHPEFLVSVATDRFLREIKLASRLNHPHIAGLIESGERKWLIYYVMSFIEGPSLREVLNRTRQLGLSDTLRITCELLDALDYAHRQGVIHRDVKPENVILSPEKGAVLLDFGIARAIVTAATDRITRTDIAVGSSAYMSPEQINAAQEIDHRSDVYSLGCMLFECLAGRPPFVRSQETLLLQLHLTEPAPDVRAFRPDVPPALAAAIGTALAKPPAERWRSAAEMRGVLANCGAGLGSVR
jgi:serine/threonine protein kinase